MNFILHTLPDREILQGESGYHYDSKVMTQRGKDYAAKKAEIAANPDHTIIEYQPQAEE